MTDYMNAQPDLIAPNGRTQIDAEQHFDGGGAGSETTDFTQLASWCAEAGLLAAQADRSTDVTQLRQDAAAVLTALSHMLARPLAADREAGLRATMEAGAIIAANCAAECRSMDGVGSTNECADSCERCADELRAALHDVGAAAPVPGETSLTL